MTTTADKRAAFRALHQSGSFVLPNPWDIGSAVRLQKLGFPALASTSAGAAWALGKGDGDLTLDELLDHLRTLSAATDLPVNADFEAGFADAPDDVAHNVGLAIQTGIAGLSVEDRTGRELYDFDLAVARIRAAKQAIAASGEDAVLVARTEGFLVGLTELEPTIARLRAFAEAGADCLYAPGVSDLDAIARIVAEVAPTPVNVLLSTTTASVAELAAVGVRRVSVGGSLAGVAWRAFDAAAKLLLDEGRLPGA